MERKANNVFRTRDAALNLHHLLAVSTGEMDTSAPGVDITLRGDRHHYVYFELQSEADLFFERLVNRWQAVQSHILVHKQVALLADAIFSIQPTGEHIVILFHHSEHQIRTGNVHNRAIYEELIAAWEAMSPG